MTEKIFTSRSAILTYKTCPYKRLLQYHLEGSGFTGGAIPLDLLIGTLVHRGIQHLLEHCRTEHPNGDFEEACVDEAVNIAKELFREILSKQSLALHAGEEDRLDWIVAEQECLFEGLIRAFAIRRLPQILDEYEILEVEKEEISSEFSSVVTLLGKCDGLFLRRHDKQLVLLSIKTASMYADVTERDILHDMQGVSEWFLVQERLDKEYKDYFSKVENNHAFTMDGNKLKLFDFHRINGTIPKIFAVQYEYLIKGQRKQDPYQSGIYKQQSFLCHPLMLSNMMPNVVFSFGQSSIVVNPDEYKWKIPKGNPGKGWAKCDIWNEIGIKTWIDMLAKGEIQPAEGNPFDTILVTPDLVVRDEREIEEWLISTRFQEENIVENISEVMTLISNRNDILKTINEVGADDILQGEIENVSKDIKEVIWQYFPKNTQNCHDFYGKDCLFVRHCHEFSSIEELRDAGYLIRRSSHHEAEQEYFEDKGFIE